MKHPLLLLVLAASALSACNPSAPATAPQHSPKIIFTETAYDFGHTDQGTVVRHVYAFRNAGGRDLTIDNVRSSCGCTAAAGPAAVVAPGAHGTIEVAFDSAGDFGRTTRTVTVYTNDPAQPVTTLTFAGEVDADVAAEPRELYVGHVAHGARVPFGINIRVADSHRVAVGPIESSSKVIDATLRDTPSRPAEKQVVVAIRDDAPSGQFREIVTVRTSSPHQPVVHIPVIGVVDVNAVSSPDRK